MEIISTLAWERLGIPPPSELVNVAPGKGSPPARAAAPATQPRISRFEDEVNSQKQGTKTNSPEKRFWFHVEDQQLVAVGLFD